MTQKRSRLQRKADRVVKSEAEREVREALGKIRADRDKKRFDANRAFDKAVEEARETLAAARKEVEDEYVEKRKTILSAFAREGVEVDAA